MNNRQTALATFLAAGLTAGAALPVSAETANTQSPASLVTVLTAADAQTQLMAMVLTTQAVEQGETVHMLLCGPGGDIALADAPESATAPQPPREMSPQGMLQMLIGRGVTVEVCAIYLPGLGADAEALIEDVGVAQPPAMAATMLAEGASVWSF
ncbi:MAG: DsrE family protein [Pararhodobacter sp.]|nr:DsrE family protein [Pararhodobacter sp.]